ncbi:hypothetical protein VTO42DRAFT_697 [Malbranchea cinnamomea]
MHEIITLQLGERSNYVATHFWNTQESYFTYSDEEESPVDHNVHFRPGFGADGTETFTPRTVIYDLKGGFGTLRKYNALYELEEPTDMHRGLWDGNEVIQRQPQIPQNEYQKALDLGLQPPRLTSEAVRYWSDFNRVFYNPKSIVQLNEYELNSQLMPFEDWAVGEDLFNSLDREHDLLDRDLRPFAEESDQMRAIQVFSGVDDAWAGFAARYMDRLRDEFAKKDIWVWALEDGVRASSRKKTLRMTNSARSINEISLQSSAYIPIMDPPRSLPTYLTADMRHKWHSSALLTMALETVTLPTRLRQYCGLGYWLTDRDNHRKIFNLESAITGVNFGPTESAKLDEDFLLRDDLDSYDLSRLLLENFQVDFSPLAPPKSKDVYVFTQCRVIRHSRMVEEGLTNGGVGRQALQVVSQPIVQRFCSSLEFPILDSFPGDLISGQGNVGSTMGVQAALSATTGIGEQVKGLQKFVRRAVATQEREHLVNGLAEIAEAYQNRWESESDSGDD